MPATLDIDFTPLRTRPGAGLVVGLSGGIDSTVLLHRLAGSEAARDGALRAVHVHHGLHADADAWQAACESTCRRLGVALATVAVRVERSGDGLEAAARAARHAALLEATRPGDVVALAHHLDDQAETFLLRALRASGPDGLAAMRPWRRFGHAWLWRPLLGHPRAAIEAYAHAHGLRGVVDPANADPAHDRSFLRMSVMPLLQARWPHASQALAAAARHAADAADLLDEDDAAALAQCRAGSTDTLSIPALRALPPTRRARVLRAWIASLQLAPLPARGVAAIEADLLDARRDAHARFAWRGASVRAWGGLLHASSPVAALAADFDAPWDGLAPFILPDGARVEISPPMALPVGTRVRARRGGERVRLPGRAHRHTLKHVLQAQRVPPWTREQLPLLVCGDEVLAAGDLVVSASLAQRLEVHGARLVWSRPPGA